MNPVREATEVAQRSLAGLGERLRHAREARRLTLEDVAEQASLTKGYISKVERNQATPSVAVLLRVCETLGLSIGDLFDPEAGQDLIRLEDRVPINFGGAGLQEALLTPRHERRLQVIHSTIKPGGGSGQELYSLPSDVEFAYVVAGRVSLTVGERTAVLSAGDAMTFSPSEAHSFHNDDDRNPAEILWVFSPALPAGWESP
jgi:transcriptional regulator with XRE-family HTH domain